MVAQAIPSTTDLYLEMQRAGDEFAIHIRVCPARRDGRDCMKCQQLDAIAGAAEDRWIGQVS